LVGVNEYRIVNRPRAVVDERFYGGQTAAIVPAARVRVGADQRNNRRGDKDEQRDAPPRAIC
jgi:hypothetical protein